MKLYLKALIAIYLVSQQGISTYAQTGENETTYEYSNDGKGWAFGLNVGVYYVSKSTSMYYNGSSENENNVDYVMSNYYWYQDIFYDLGANDSISVAGLPDNTHYKLAMQPGLYAQYCFNKKLSLIIEFNYTRLKVEDVIIFEVDPKSYATEPDLRLYPIHGSEERIYADLGMKHTFPQTDNFSYFAMGGLNVNSTQVRKSSFFVEETEYSMINNIDGGYVPNGNNQTYNVYQGGIGIGIFAGGGASFTFGNGIVLEPGIKVHWLKVKLKRYEDMNPGAGFYIRFLF
jgi:hypothetical protein